MSTSKWCITYWLTEGRTVETFQSLVDAMPSNWSIEGQIEQGHCKNDKLHAQIFLKTEKTRGTKVTKYFPSCYLSEATNPFALKNYVHKIDTRVGEFKTVENRSPQWREVRKTFYQWYILNYDYNLGFLVEDEEKMKYWDKFIGISMEEGMEIDLVGVNPQYRSCIMKYWDNCIRIALSQKPVSVDNGTTGQIQVVEIPVVGGGVCPASNIPVSSPPLIMKK